MMMEILCLVYRKIFARAIFIKWNKLLFSCSLRGLGIYNFENMNISGEKNFIQRYLLKDSANKDTYVVFDVGANNGDYTNIITNLLHNAKVYSFEPHPATFKRLHARYKDKENIILFNCALSNLKGEMNLYDHKASNGSAHASLNSEIFSVIHKSEATSINALITTIDIVCKENSIEFIDFLKIDVEGYELKVLEGASRMISNHLIHFIQFEFTQLNTTTRIYFKDFWEKLSPDYHIYRLLPDALMEIKNYDPTINEIFGYQNYVAIIKE